MLGESITKAAVDDREQGVQEEVAEALLTSALDNFLAVDDPLVDHSVRDGSIGTIPHRWQPTEDWTARKVGIAIHAEIVRIPFAGGKCRGTRLLADLLFAAAQVAKMPEL